MNLRVSFTQQVERYPPTVLSNQSRCNEPYFLFQGFDRVYENMPDLAIDVPPAYNILERFVTRCRSLGIIDDELVRKMPTRGRKRFVSEGDGGRVKEEMRW
jgi:programmed cell death protein 4